jgi:hypothetical protein
MKEGVGEGMRLDGCITWLGLGWLRGMFLKKECPDDEMRRSPKPGQETQLYYRTMDHVYGRYKGTKKRRLLSTPTISPASF